MQALTEAPARWFPSILTWRDGDQADIEWIHVGDARFEEAFVADTLEKWMRRPANAAFRPRTSLDALIDGDEAAPGVVPSGLIFHVSRCGSTWLTRLLGGHPDTLVLSEPPLLDRLIRCNDQTPRLERGCQIRAIRAVAGAMGRPRTETQSKVFIKLDAWHLLYADLILEAFPETPWIMLYRDPVEVLVSQLRQRGLHMIPGYLRADLIGPDAAAPLPAVEYGARVLGALFERGARLAAGPGGVAIDYAELPDAFVTKAATIFALDTARLDATEERTRIDAKRGGVFIPDAAAKRADATPEVREACDRWVYPYFHALRAAG
ncbi:MAG: sulfotransferase [Brevundimonas sp.]|uniref:sulfotransferase n=1 Tax=Brevundimonas sp. TaxID=1871086 RepID=UPI004033F7A9